MFVYNKYMLCVNRSSVRKKRIHLKKEPTEKEKQVTRIKCTVIKAIICLLYVRGKRIRSDFTHY